MWTAECHGYFIWILFCSEFSMEIGNFVSLPAFSKWTSAYVFWNSKIMLTMLRCIFVNERSMETYNFIATETYTRSNFETHRTRKLIVKSSNSSNNFAIKAAKRNIKWHVKTALQIQLPSLTEHEGGEIIDIKLQENSPHV